MRKELVKELRKEIPKTEKDNPVLAAYMAEIVIEQVRKNIEIQGD